MNKADHITNPDNHDAPLNDEQWKADLSPEVYRVTRQCGTEPPFSGKYYRHHEKGDYLCICCHSLLFHAGQKYDSGSGWPSFFGQAGTDSIRRIIDTSHGMQRIEIRCANCDAHLGHVFPDGPMPSGERYCVNSLSLDFSPSKQHE